MISPEQLLRGYASGIFPMGTPDGGVQWFHPDPRGILPLDRFHVPHGLRRTLRRQRFQLRLNHAFDKVVACCGKRRETWITPLVARSYSQLHRLGFAHSVEAWCDGELCGGLYGVSLGRAFFGESMFHRRTDASKAALWALVQLLRENKFSLLDIQWTTPHLRQFGAVDIPAEMYRAQLEKCLEGAELRLLPPSATELDFLYETLSDEE